MRDNVLITARERGKIVARREGHNIFVDLGRQWLAELISLLTTDPDVPDRIDLIKYMGFGIGGNEQTLPGEVTSAPLVTAYPVGSDPNVTTGFEHNETFPLKPLGSGGGVIETLEVPVRIAGGVTTYPGDPGDQWLSTPSPPDFIIAHPSPTETNYHARFDAGAGDFLYGPFTRMPLSEAGLFLSSVSHLGTPFNPLVAYHTFDTILLSPEIELEVVWTVRF